MEKHWRRGEERRSSGAGGPLQGGGGHCGSTSRFVCQSGYL